MAWLLRQVLFVAVVMVVAGVVAAAMDKNGKRAIAVTRINATPFQPAAPEACSNPAALIAQDRWTPRAA